MRLHEKRSKVPSEADVFFCGLTSEVMHAGEKAKHSKSSLDQAC